MADFAFPELKLPKAMELGPFVLKSDHERIVAELVADILTQRSQMLTMHDDIMQLQTDLQKARQSNKAFSTIRSMFSKGDKH